MSAGASVFTFRVYKIYEGIMREAMKQYKMIMFDMDGTIVDSFFGHADCFKRYLEKFGVEMDRNQISKMMGNTMDIIFANTLPEDKQTEALSGLSDFYRTEIDDLVDDMDIIEGSTETIAQIKEKGYWVTLLTNSKKELVERIIERKKLGQLFDMIKPADVNEVDKVMRCEHIFEHFNVQPNEVLYVGDSSHDVALARDTGMTSCLIDNETSWVHHESFSGAFLEPDISINHISKVLDII